ncbi:glycosyltransferase [Frateuria edaphi]|uniref:glycosyltransferase family 2 protein n=1 Tax=Frateuria edaphi TaxID=2898793 RepID=UPI001E28264C|nr:glycosyltransferase [Frateuria edaphi]UGB46556.1 glycosyltransferase [Frateuria edaphi]
MLAECLDSVLSQQPARPIEIIVHDDASTDSSVAFLREHYPQVEILASADNVGFCIGNNRMVEHARGEYVLLLNNDAALYPDALDTLLATAGAGDRRILTLPQYDWVSGTLVDRGCRLDPFYNPVPNLAPGRSEVAMVIGACLFLPRALWGELGGFPDWMGSIGEDLYLCCRARLTGAGVSTTANSGYRHRQGQSFGGNRVDGGKMHTTYLRRQLSERNKTATLIICTPTWLVWPLLLAHLIALSLEGALLAGWRRDRRIWTSIYAKTWRSVASNWHDWLTRRRQVQGARRIGLRDYFALFVPAPRKLVLFLRHGFPAVRQ